ncbi:ABC transporter substrate-binding protein [Ammoniphilus sp. 3BR4]|uniref:ABC transporter substrate-binding protein n=1 Tax=Ammoniphilus sp. 3BR4 TaxID=3158265 RepID=UPI003465C140
MKLACKLRVSLLVWMMVMVSILSACNSSGQGEKETSVQPVKTEDKQKEPEKPKAYQPVTIQNYHREITFEEVPKRVVSLNQHTTEIMLALGLENYIVGTAYNSDGEYLPELKEKFSKIPVLAEKYPSLEVLLGINPDFVYGRESAFSGKEALAAVDDLAKYGIKAYVAKGTYVTAAKMEDVYEDILNLGRIFNIEQKAQALVQSMQKDIQEIKNKVGKVEKPIRVLVFDSGEDTVFTAGQSLQTSLIAMAGGKNVFDDIEKNWAKVSWEEVVKRDPEVIVINDYGKTSADEKIKLLLNNPAMADVKAIKNKSFVVLPLSSVFEGVRNVSALETLAKGFYPEKFK